MGICTCSVKFLLYVFNFLVVLCGIAILVLGVLSQTQGKVTTPFTNYTITGSSIALIVLGVVVFLIAFMGCCGAIRDSTCMLSTYAAFLLVILVLEIAIGVYAFVNKNSFENDLKTNIDDFFDNYEVNQASIDAIQQELECCGGESPYTINVPKSCCAKDSKLPCTIFNRYQTSCEKKLVNLISSLFTKVGIGAIVVGGIEILGVLFSCFLVSSIKRNVNRGYV